MTTPRRRASDDKRDRPGDRLRRLRPAIVGGEEHEGREEEGESGSWRVKETDKALGNRPCSVSFESE